MPDLEVVSRQQVAGREAFFFKKKTVFRGWGVKVETSRGECTNSREIGAF